MMSSLDSNKQRRIDVVPLFEDKDFGLWKLRAEAIFMANDLLDVVENNVLEEEKSGSSAGGAAAASSSTTTKGKHESKATIAIGSEKDETRKRSHRAYGMLLQSLQSEQLRLVQHVQRGDAHGVWLILLDTYERKSMATKVQLLEQLFSLQMQRNDSIASYVAHLTEIERKLHAQEENISESILIYVLLRGLPSTFTSIVQLIKMKEKLEMKETIELLKSEEERQGIHTKGNGNGQGQQKPASGMHAHTTTSSSSGDRPCFTCGATGHKKFECPRNKGEKKCNNCHRVGHTEGECWNKQGNKKVQHNNMALVDYAMAM